MLAYGRKCGNIYKILSQIFYKKEKLSYVVGLTYNFCHVTCVQDI